MSDTAAAPRLVPEGIRPTKVGVWFAVLTLVVGIAGTNTGNNALYMVLAVMLATLAVSGLLSRNNVRHLEVEVSPPAELFAESGAVFRVSVKNRGRYSSRWLLVVSVSDDSSSTLFPYIPKLESSEGTIELTFEKRGLYNLKAAHLATLFPLGFFRKGMRHAIDCEVLIYPRLRRCEWPPLESGSSLGILDSRRRGWGHELHSLRALRPGDDPRRIHWKQSARTGRLIFMEREAEENRRISIVLDNSLDLSDGGRAQERLEKRIGEAAFTALEYLKSDYQVELITRTTRIPFGNGSRQRKRVLKALAMLEAAPPNARPLSADGVREVRFEV